MIIRKKYYILVILIIAVISRTIFAGDCPGGLHADEAFSGYEAWSLLNYGIDSAGYANPVYLTVWGGGMSVLNSALMLPGIALFGLNAVTVRLHAIIMGIISVYVFYLLLKEIYDERTAVWGSGLLAVSPWHIMISRYGMDANLCPAFVLIAMYLTVIGIKNNRWLKWAAAAWGIALYSYAVLWIFEPIFLLLLFIYCLRHKKLTNYKQVFGGAIALAVTAAPLMLFICVNMGILPEIRTSIISIPRLPGFRSGELGAGGYILNIKRIVKCFILQSDGYIWNSIPGFGVYYIFSTPASAVGLAAVTKKAVSDFKNKIFGYEAVLLMWIVSALIMAFMQTTGTNLTRINPINPAMFILVTVGIRCIADKIKYKRAEAAIAGLYMAAFLCFMAYYFTIYADSIKRLWWAGAGEALEYAEEIYKTGEYGGKIYIAGPLRHSQVLFHTQFPTDEYIETVEYNDVVNGVYDVKGFGNFEWGKSADYRGIHVISADEALEYADLGYDIKMFDKCAVAVP